MEFEYRLVLKTPAGEFYSEPRIAFHNDDVMEACRSLGDVGRWLVRAEAKKNGKDWETL